ncbi:MAG: response regulator transcription factor [Phycisphaerales bacterium]|nr:response regulator transcription factor [Phycisphaerales bacterium]
MNSQTPPNPARASTATPIPTTHTTPPAGEPKRILIVEDERDLAEMLSYNLARAGYLPTVAADGQRAVQLAQQSPPDCIVLDLMLPVMPGLEVARILRESPSTTSIPILMLTARAEEADELAGLAAGADDYVTKPFSVKVVLARIEALLRRTPSRGQSAPAGSVTLGLVHADLEQHTVTSAGDSVKLTLTEFNLLVALMGSPRRVLSRNELIAKVMGPGVVVTTRTIDVHIASIRRKLNHAGGQIRTIRGVGYQMSAEIHAEEQTEA